MSQQAHTDMPGFEVREARFPTQIESQSGRVLQSQNFDEYDQLVVCDLGVVGRCDSRLVGVACVPVSIARRTLHTLY